MKILYTHLYDAEFRMGGAERVLWHLLGEIRGRFAQEVMCAVNPGDFSQAVQELEIPVMSLEWSKFKTPETLRRLGKVIADFRPDLVHSHHRYVTFLLDIFFKRRIPILHTEHVLRKDKRLLFRYGHFVTAVNDSIRGNLIDHYRVPENAVQTIYNAVPRREADLGRVDELSKKYRCRPEQLKLLSIGRFDIQKGHRYLIEAVGAMPESDRKQLKIFFAGDGPLERYLRNSIYRRNLQEHFVFLGYCEEIPEFLTLCDGMVLPSLWEGMPLSILEAFSFSKMVIATNIPGSRDLVLHDKTGILVPPRDVRNLAKALGELLREKGRIHAMGKAAHELWQRNYSFDTMIANYEACYRKIFEAYGRST